MALDDDTSPAVSPSHTSMVPSHCCHCTSSMRLYTATRPTLVLGGIRTAAQLLPPRALLTPVAQMVLFEESMHMPAAYLVANVLLRAAASRAAGVSEPARAAISHA